MDKGKTQEIRTLEVTSSNVGATPDGKVAIVLMTEEGAFGFGVTLRSCEALRRDIATAEAFLRQNPEHA